MARKGKAIVMPFGSVRLPTVSLWSQLKSVRLLIPILTRRKHMALEGWPNLLDLDQLELSAYIQSKLGAESLDYVVRPLMLAYSMSEPEGISVAYFLRSLWMYATTGAHCFKTGNDALPKALARDLGHPLTRTASAPSRLEFGAARVPSAVHLLPVPVGALRRPGCR